MEHLKKLTSTLFPHKIAKLLTFILMLILAWTLGRLAWSWFKEPTVGAPLHVSVPNIQQNESPEYSISNLLRTDLFGKFIKQSEIKQQKPNIDNLPKIRMNLKLVGVVASTDENRSLAIISHRNKQGVYGVGDTLEGTQVALRYVLSDRIILDNSGRDETLILEGVDESSKTGDIFERINKSDNQPEKKLFSDDQDLSVIRQDILKNPQSLLKYITLAQERDGNGVIGYRLGPGRDNRLFKNSGLKRGDVAIEINNVDLTDPSKMNLIWKNLSDASEISLTVLRNGQRHQINIGL